MGQVTIYLDNETEAKMRASAEAMNVSKSKWVASVIQEKLADKWPASVRESAGAWHDFPSQEELRDEQKPDIHRETL